MLCRSLTHRRDAREEPLFSRAEATSRLMTLWGMRLIREHTDTWAYRQVATFDLLTGLERVVPPSSGEWTALDTDLINAADAPAADGPPEKSNAQAIMEAAQRVPP
jgi:phage tail sheath protein FI